MTFLRFLRQNFAWFADGELFFYFLSVWSLWFCLISFDSWLLHCLGTAADSNFSASCICFFTFEFSFYVSFFGLLFIINKT